MLRGTRCCEVRWFCFVGRWRAMRECLCWVCTFGGDGACMRIPPMQCRSSGEGGGRSARGIWRSDACGCYGVARTIVCSRVLGLWRVDGGLWAPRRLSPQSGPRRRAPSPIELALDGRSGRIAIGERRQKKRLITASAVGDVGRPCSHRSDRHRTGWPSSGSTRRCRPVALDIWEPSVDVSTRRPQRIRWPCLCVRVCGAAGTCGQPRISPFGSSGEPDLGALFVRLARPRAVRPRVSRCRV